MLFKKTLLTLLINLVQYSYCVDVIMIMGPSCGGKSTLSKTLVERLNQSSSFWARVDFDEVGENIDNLIATINQHLARGVNVVVDTNTYKENMEQRFVVQPALIIKALVYAPLPTLLERDEKRNKKLQRSGKRAHYAREFVQHSFEYSQEWKVDIKINSADSSIEECCTQIIDFYQTQNVR